MTVSFFNTVSAGFFDQSRAWCLRSIPEKAPLEKGRAFFSKPCFLTGKNFPTAVCYGETRTKQNMHDLNDKAELLFTQIISSEEEVSLHFFEEKNIPGKQERLNRWIESTDL
jgi:hypothetical protein